MSNSSLKVIIVDDEKKACANLKNILHEFVDSNIEIVGCANTTDEAEMMIRKFIPDAVFLDIEMPNENAFNFLSRISPIQFEVVFVTAYEEYAIRAFRLNAVDYILKPISINELNIAVQKLKEKISYKNLIKNDSIEYDDLSNQIKSRIKQNKIVLKDLHNTCVVNFDDIYFVEAQGSYSRVVFSKENSIKEMTLSSPLSEYEDMLPSDIFYRIHRSYLINCTCIIQIVSEGTHYVAIKGNLHIPVSRRRYASLVEFLENNNYL